MCVASPCRAIARSRRAVKNRDGPPARCDAWTRAFARKDVAAAGGCSRSAAAATTARFIIDSRARDKRCTASKRRARARHQASPLGRKDHRDHQRAYRARQRQLRASVTDQGSREVDAATKVSMPAQPLVTTLVNEAQRGGSDLNGLKRDLVRCAFCERTSGWIRRGYLRRSEKARQSGAG